MNALMEQLKDRQTINLESAEAEYAEILRRNNKPHEGDAARLAELIELFKLTPANVASDIAALSDAADAEKSIAEWEQRLRDPARLARLAELGPPPDANGGWPRGTMVNGKLATFHQPADAKGLIPDAIRALNELAAERYELNVGYALNQQLSFWKNHLSEIQRRSPRPFKGSR